MLSARAIVQNLLTTPVRFSKTKLQIRFSHCRSTLKSVVSTPQNGPEFSMYNSFDGVLADLVTAATIPQPAVYSERRA